MSSHADATYMREYRSKNSAARELNLAATTARRSAMRRLARRHPAEFEVLLSEERALKGLPPVGVLKRGRKAKDAA